MVQISDADVKNILKNDGISFSELDGCNREVTSLSDVIKMFPEDESWSYTLVNSQSNSATLICQLPGEGNRKHHHPDWDEWWFIIEGVWEWEIEGTKRIINKNDIVFIGRGRKHKITAAGEDRAIRLAVSRYDVAHVYDEGDY